MKSKIQLDISVAWWLRIYLRLLEFFCILMATEPDWPKVSRVVKAGISVRVRK